MISICASSPASFMRHSLRLWRSGLSQTIFREFSIMHQGKTVYDVVISGCGPVGAGLACALSSSSLFSQDDKSMLILDQASESSLEAKLIDTPDQRVYSISGSTQRFLKSTGAWDNFDKTRLGVTEQMQVWESTGNGYVKFTKPEDESEGNLGVLIENAQLVSGLVKRLKSLNKVEFSLSDNIQAITREGNLNRITLKSGRDVYSRVLVGSDGRGSAVKKLNGIGTYGWNYNQMGIVCTVKTSRAARNTSYQRYLPTGPLAILPLWEDFSSIVWSVPIYEYEELIKLGDVEFQNALNKALSGKNTVDTPTISLSPEGLKSDFTAPPIITSICNKRLAFPLSQLQSQRYIAPGIALIGDAAHSIHPHAGQGVNTGINDAVTLANVLIKNKRVGHNLGELMSLEEYETTAKSFNYANAFAMEAIKKIYELPSGPLAFIRNIGANIVNNSAFAKTAMMKIASQNPLAPTSYEWER